MRKIFFIVFLFCNCLVASYAQDCALKLNTARDYKSKSDFKNAVKWYKKVLSDCGDYDGKVYYELKECEKKISEMNVAFLLEQSKLECDGKGGTLVMELKKAPTDWSVTQWPEWVQLSEINKENRKVIFNVSANPKVEIRKGTIQLITDKGKTQEFIVTQKAGEERLVVQKDNISFNGDGGQQTVTIDANFNWNYSVSESWIRPIRENEKLIITCPTNELAKKRNAEIYIYGMNVTRTIYVTQSEGDTYFSITGASDNTLHVGSYGGKNSSLQVSCNDDWNVNNSCQWLNVSTLGNTIVVQYETNPWAENRTASFEVLTVHEKRKMTILVEQDGAKPTLEKVSLPERGGERKVSATGPHSRSVSLKGDGGSMKVVVYSNVQTWSCRIVPDDEDWIIVEETSPKDSLLKLKLSDNNGWNTREADVIISAKGIQDTLHVRQNKRGYRGILDDYFEGYERNWKTTRFFIDLFGAESLGFSIGGFAKRWRFVEFSLLDFDVKYVYHEERASQDIVQALHLDWNPIVRGYLPLSRAGHRWAAYIGMGVSVNVLSLDVAPKVAFSYFNTPHFLFEIGAEFNWIKKDNVSSRIFYRYDGYSSVGISFDFYKWTKKWKE